jgi:hypothetical protein
MCVSETAFAYLVIDSMVNRDSIAIEYDSIIKVVLIYIASFPKVMTVKGIHLNRKGFVIRHVALIEVWVELKVNSSI